MLDAVSAAVRTRVVPLVLLLVFVVAAGLSLVGDSATFDETAHLPAGFTYLDRGDFRMNPEHPPLSKAWAALPLWVAGSVEPDYDAAPWRGRQQAQLDGRRSKASEWSFGYAFLNESGRHPRELLIPARLAMLVPGVLLGLVVWRWSHELWGPAAGLLSLFLYCVSPTMLAHTRLVTTDLATAFGFTLALWTFWRFCRSPRLATGSAFALAFALSLLIKFSTLLLVPILALVGTAWVLRGAEDRTLRAQQAALVLAFALVVGYAGIWVGYGLRFAAAVDPGYALDWDVVGLKEGPAAAFIARLIAWRLLPEGYLFGLAYFLGGAAKRLAYLNGAQSIVGWWYYFPEAFLLKTPLATLALTGWLGFGALASGRWRSPKALFLVTPIVVYVGVSMASNLNIGHRHLTPIYPLLFVALGAVTRIVGDDRRRQIVLGTLLLGSVASFLIAAPGYLSYFNALAGGSRGGPRYLLDSNVDWGQDLDRLASWMKRERVPSVHLAYFGTASPEAYGIDYRKVVRVHDFAPELPTTWPESGDHLAVSVNLLYGLYYDTERWLAEGLVRRGALAEAAIRRWLDLRRRLSDRGERHPGLAEWLLSEGLTDAATVDAVRAELLSSRLARVREELTPIAHAGDSILIYRIP